MRSALLAILFVGCTSTAPVDHASTEATSTPARDWSNHPALVDLPASDVYAVSDVHGEYPAFTKILAANHLIDGAAAPHWTGGNAVLVIAGDLIDKGPESLEVIDLVRSLEQQAPSSGGRVVTTMGNHEAEFLHDPRNSKATSTGLDKQGIDQELVSTSTSPESLANETDAVGRGAWLASLPLGARVGRWFFSHAGNTQRLSFEALAHSLQSSLDRDGFGSAQIIGDNSILEAEDWYGAADDPNAGKAEAAALGVDHLAFGHDPKAFGDRGQIRASANGVLVKLDTAMGIHKGSGVEEPYLLHLPSNGSAEVLDEDGHARPLP